MKITTINRLRWAGHDIVFDANDKVVVSIHMWRKGSLFQPRDVDTAK